jgi:hypothetical protein
MPDFLVINPISCKNSADAQYILIKDVVTEEEALRLFNDMPGRARTHPRRTVKVRQLTYDSAFRCIAWEILV